MQYTIGEVDFDEIGNLEPIALVERIGHFVNDTLAIEGRLGIGLQDEDLLRVEVDIDSIHGVYPVFYGIIGFSDADATAISIGYVTRF